MRPEEIHNIAMALGSTVVKTTTLAGGFSHETCLLTLADGQVVARLGGPDPAIEAAVMAAARPFAPVPQVLRIVLATAGAARTDIDARPAMILEYVAGTPLSEVLAQGGHETSALRDLGAEVGRVVAGIAAVTFERRGFFTDDQLTVLEAPPWSQQLAGFAETCMTATSGVRLDRSARLAWVDLCAANAPALKAIDNQSRLVHGDINPKNILVSRKGKAWRVDAVLDWEFGFSGCPYGDAANMTRFGADYPAGFVDGFRAGFAEHQPPGLPLAEEWSYLGCVLDMFALSDLVTRPADNPVADQAARLIRRWISEGVMREPFDARARTLYGMNLDDLPRVEFAFPGPLRDQLVAAILSGAKTSTSGLVLGYERENEPLPRVGQHMAVVDSQDRRVAAIELTEVRVVRLADVDLQHALDEGEGDESVAQWRAGHERFWHSAEVRAELGDPSFTVNDDTLVLAQRFRLVDV